ncbi:hypothetical protein H6G55_28875 [Leptolyngbya sp. FACHB-161]|nr:hypothetical protein [Leptolyngbya sp. FACHB-161]
MLCFLHTVLGIQQRCRRLREVCHTVTDKLWHLYYSSTLRQFAQRLRRLHEWASNPKIDLPDAVRQKLLGLKAKAPQFTVAFDLPDAARTSNQVDRLINYQDRLLYAMQYFHGTLASANQALRAMALLWNFHPYCYKVRSVPPYVRSPFEALNGFRYHDHWLRNLLIATLWNFHPYCYKVRSVPPYVRSPFEALNGFRYHDHWLRNLLIATLWNFHPYCYKVRSVPPYVRSPFEALNGFRYHDHWLRNLLIATSLNGRGTAKPVKHKQI